MPRCEHCGFGHALPDRCVNCGSPDPFPRRRLIRRVLVAILVCAAVVLTYHFYERAKALQLAEDKAKAVTGEVLALPTPAAEEAP